MRRSPPRGDAQPKDRALPGRPASSPAEPLNKKAPEVPPQAASQWPSGLWDKKTAESGK